MAFARPFAFNTGTTIPGTIQIGNLAVGVDNVDYSEQPGGVQWWNGPDEELGYVIAHETPSGTQPNPLSIPAYVGFWRSGELTTPSFVTLAQWVSAKDNDPQTFTGGTEAKTWLNNNGYWTSYSEYIKSTEKTNTGGFPVGYFIDKDMSYGDTLFYPSESLPGGVSQNITSSYWDDWGDDIFDVWGYFYLYDPTQNNYLGLEFLSNDTNLPDGEFRTTTFNFNGRTFNILQGYPVEGIFKFEITVNDNLPFVFGEGGNMGSDGGTVNGDLTYNYSYDGNNMTLWYNENYQSGNEQERFYTYYIPYNINQNTNQTYTKTLNSDNLYFYSIEVNNGLTVYHSKGVDVKEWVVYDLGGGEVVPTTTTTTTITPTTTTTTTEAPTTTTTTTSSPVSGFTINIYESGSDVVMTASGSLNINDLTFVNNSNLGGGGIGINTATFIMGALGSFDTYSGITTFPSSFGTGSGAGSSSSSGDIIGVIVDMVPPYFLAVPSGYTSGSQISSIQTFNNQSFSSLGLTPGTYTYTWGSGANADAINVVVGGTPPVTTTTTTTSGATGQWEFYYSTEGPLNVDAPTNDGNIIFVEYNGGSPQQTFDPNYSGGQLSIYINVNDSSSNNYTSQFTELDLSGGTLTLTQNGNTAVYTSSDLDYYMGPGGTPPYEWLELRIQDFDIQTTQSPQPFVYGQPITVTVF